MAWGIGKIIMWIIFLEIKSSISIILKGKEFAGTAREISYPASPLNL